MRIGSQFITRFQNAVRQRICTRQLKNSLETPRQICVLIIIICSPYTYCKPDIEYLLNLKNSFTWEELPTRDPDTGYLTKAGYIPIIQSLTKYAVNFVMLVYTIQAAERLVFTHEMLLTSWFPLDLTAVPVYVFANIVQVEYTVYIH